MESHDSTVQTAQQPRDENRFIELRELLMTFKIQFQEEVKQLRSQIMQRAIITQPCPPLANQMILRTFQAIPAQMPQMAVHQTLPQHYPPQTMMWQYPVSGCLMFNPSTLVLIVAVDGSSLSQKTVGRKVRKYFI